MKSSPNYRLTLSDHVQMIKYIVNMYVEVLE